MPGAASAPAPGSHDVATARVRPGRDSFTLEIASADGPIRLTLTGPAGIHEFLDAELPAIL
jgi:hypothetical protein